MPTRSRAWRAVAALTALAALTAACGDDDDEPTDDPTEETDGATDSTEPADEPTTVEITARDYLFEGVPAEVAAGTTLELTNASELEVHELVAFHVPDTETRSVEELLQLPEEEVGPLLGEPATVLVAMPGQDGAAVVGDGALTEPGRYVFICAIPIGADPAIYQAAIDSGSEEPPEIPDAGPPHFTQGMAGELTVS